MVEKFKISPSMTKKEIIEKYASLLDAYKNAALKAKETEKWRSEAEKYKEAVAIKETRDATVESVTRNIGQLRGQVKETLDDLAEKLASETERLEQINLAIAAQERRLKELYDVEEFQDALAKLATAYEERKLATEQEYARRLKELEDEFVSRKDALSKEIEAARGVWAEEKERFAKQFEEQKAMARKQWEREQAEYEYERQRKRRIEENQYEEDKQALEKELQLKKETLEKEFAEKQAALEARENEYRELKEKVAEFPALLDAEVKKTVGEALKKASIETDHQIKILTTEHSWQNKVYEQKIKFLEDVVASQETKIAELKAEVSQAMDHVHKIAEKAVEGASQVKAFRSVKEIALQQAKKPEPFKEK